MLTMQQSMNLAPEYAMFNQRNLTCYWGNRDELSDKQRKIIKELGYTYRGKNQWLYFLSFELGYYLYNMDGEEVLRMSEYLQDLELALRYYDETDMQVDFESGNMFLFSFGKDKKTWDFSEEPLPFTAFQFGAPKEIRVSNVIVEAGLEQICNVCDIKLRRVKRLKGLEEFKYSMQRFR